MSDVGQRERKAQERVVGLFREPLGFEFLGDWRDREGNSNVERELLRANLSARGYSDKLIVKALFELERRKELGGGSLYETNRDVYERLRYGIKVSPEPGENKKTVELIDWEDPEANHFAIAEEVTVEGNNTKRPDVVIYVNGIAVGVLELKRSLVSVTKGIRQHLGNQSPEFIQPFFTTVQLLLAGNDSEGLRYGTIGTPEKQWMRWREKSDLAAGPLDVALHQMCSKQRLLELIHDFIVFDSGEKKTSRHNQFFGVKAAQARIEDREDGIVWHAQGSGKSLTMVWLAKWIRGHQTDPRVLLVTDREELDDQIEKVFKGVQEDIYRTASGADLVSQLNTNSEWLICSLIHKFGSTSGGGESVEAFIAELRKNLPADFSPKGNIFVFVDECHRTQSGKLREAMKELLPGAMFVGFTGTPLLKGDKQRSIAIFGSYIHTYKFDEAVKDEAIVDLRYEARDIDQEITSPERVDAWFEAKTTGLTDLARAELKKRWGTMQKVLTAKSRAEKIVADILLDMERQPRLLSGRGNAMLVAGDIDQAYRYYELFNQTPLKGKVGIVTSYKPSPGDIAKENAGAGEDEVKRRFVEEPARMRLLIVVDKLLTGFDAPPATFLYIDKKMRDHGLFQAICRVNRLHGEDKKYGCIVDYKDLFNSIESAYADYTGEALSGYDSDDVAGLLEDRLERGREQLDGALERIRALCEPVAAPRGTLEYQHRFCAEDTADPDALKENEPLRVELYTAVTGLVRAYAALANEMTGAGYTAAETGEIKNEVRHYEQVRGEVKLGAGESLDYTAYEPDMRYLLDAYVRAGEPERTAGFDEEGLVRLLADGGVEEAIGNLPEGIRGDWRAVSETIENNTRKLIADELAVNPRYFGKMSELLDALIEQRREEALDYGEYLRRLQELARKVVDPGQGGEYPAAIETGAQRALFDNLGGDEALALKLDETILRTREDSWRGHLMKERRLRKAIEKVLDSSAGDGDVGAILELVKHQEAY